jgi:hypothetical protein
MRTDGRTDKRELIATFRNFANTSKNCYKPIILVFVAIIHVLIIKLRLHSLIQNCQIMSVHCFNKGFLIHLVNLFQTKSAANAVHNCGMLITSNEPRTSKCLIAIAGRGPKRICPKQLQLIRLGRGVCATETQTCSLPMRF